MPCKKRPPVLMTFRKLSRKEAETFREWARQNFKPNDKLKPTRDIDSLWHPVVQAECAMILAYADYVEGGTM